MKSCFYCKINWLEGEGKIVLLHGCLYSRCWGPKLGGPEAGFLILTLLMSDSCGGHAPGHSRARAGGPQVQTHSSACTHAAPARPFLQNSRTENPAEESAPQRCVWATRKTDPVKPPRVPLELAPCLPCAPLPRHTWSERRRHLCPAATPAVSLNDKVRTET